MNLLAKNCLPKIATMSIGGSDLKPANSPLLEHPAVPQEKLEVAKALTSKGQAISLSNPQSYGQRTNGKNRSLSQPRSKQRSIVTSGRLEPKVRLSIVESLEKAETAIRGLEKEFSTQKMSLSVFWANIKNLKVELTNQKIDPGSFQSLVTSLNRLFEDAKNNGHTMPKTELKATLKQLSTLFNVTEKIAQDLQQEANFKSIILEKPLLEMAFNSFH